MKRRRFLFGSVATLIAASNAKISHAIDWSLVTQEDFDRELSEAKAFGPLEPGRRGAFTVPVLGEPKIEVKQPDPSKNIKLPVTIIVTFTAEGDAKIVVSSFRAVYGTFIKLDITEKIKAHAKLDENGLFAEGVSVPTGKHNVTISIADNRGRIGTRAFQFTVGL
jgi:hypothetical protein